MDNAHSNDAHKDPDRPRVLISKKTYWRRQLRRTSILLLIWAIVGFGLSILFVEQLNQIHLGTMPLGFWMAQQGSIFVFILLILAYALMMERADRDAGLEETREGRISPQGPAGAS